MTPREVFEFAHRLVRAYDIGYADCFAESGVLVLPFAPSSMPRRVEGRQAIRQMLEPRYAASRNSGRHILEYRDLHIHETTDPEVIVVEFEAIGVNSDGTQAYQLPFIQVMRIRDDKIVEQRDYFDSLALTGFLRA